MSVKIYEYDNYKEIRVDSCRRSYTHYECKACDYTTKRKDLIEKHVATHANQVRG